MTTKLVFTLLSGIVASVPLLSQTLPPSATTFADPSKYVPGVTFQSTNPNYPIRNPFYFEGRVDWGLLKITTPSNAWEYAQRGIHEQDDLEDIPDAINDYNTAISMNNLTNGTCQLITSSVTGFGQSVNPPPCMFTVRLRLGNLLKASNPQQAISLFNQVLQIDPLRLGVNAMIGDTYQGIANATSDPVAQTAALNQAVAAYKAELLLSPITPLSVSLTGDMANNAHVHWSLAEVYQQLDDPIDQANELTLYLQATQWHSDTYAWRIQLAQNRLVKIQSRTNIKKPVQK
jgi:tetratricopeptide (TPR) repeat protein